MQSRELLAFAMALGVALMGSLSHWAAKRALNEIPPVTFLFHRAVAGVLTLLVLLLVFSPSALGEWRRLTDLQVAIPLAMAFLFAIVLTCFAFFYGLQVADLGLMSVLTGTAPMMFTILSVSFLGEKLTGPMILGETMVIAGILYLGWVLQRERRAKASGSRLAAIFLGLGTAAGASTGNFFIKMAVDRAASPPALISLGLIVPGLLFFFLYWLHQGRPAAPLTARRFSYLSGGLAWGGCIYLTMLAFELSRFPSMVTSVMACNVVFGILLGWLLLGEILTARKLLAFSLVFAGGLVIVLGGQMSPGPGPEPSLVLSPLAPIHPRAHATPVAPMH